MTEDTPIETADYDDRRVLGLSRLLQAELERIKQQPQTRSLDFHYEKLKSFEAIGEKLREVSCYIDFYFALTTLKNPSSHVKQRAAVNSMWQILDELISAVRGTISSLSKPTSEL